MTAGRPDYTFLLPEEHSLFMDVKFPLDHYLRFAEAQREDDQQRCKEAFIRSVRVAKGFDVADHRIVQEMQPGDLVITADIPLAAEVIARGAHALDPRGELYSEDNVRERLAVRNLLQELRSGGELIGGPAPFSQSDQHLFANHLDRFLTRRRDA